MSDVQLHEKYLKLGYAVVGSLVTFLVLIGIWIGSHAVRLTNVEARHDRTVNWIKETNTTVDARFIRMEDKLYDLWKTLPPEQRTAKDER